MSLPRSSISCVRALSSASRASGVLVLFFGMPATIASRETPIAPASADADPPPGVGSDDAKASRRLVTDCCINMRSPMVGQRAGHDAPPFEYRRDRRGVDPKKIDGRSVDQDGVELFAGLEAADARVAIERGGAVDCGGDQRFLERHAHRKTRERHRER